ncbi:unnamed protein product [Sphagnum balticum]
MSDEEFNTPLREREDKEQRSTAFKHEEESHIRDSEHEEEDAGANHEEELNIAEKEIKEVEERLDEIRRERAGVDESGEEYERLEDERRVLRKRLIDLDHGHKRAFLKLKSQKEREDKLEREEREQKLKEELE